MNSSEIRKQFIDFFKQKQHQFVPSAPVVPADDPTLLFTNAGMNQFKDIFLDKRKPSYTRAVNSQKCIRVSGKHNDLEEVGRDTYHHTFFEMLGNWSFGDYYKKEAISWAWELFTEVWGLPKEKLYATVHHSDEEALRLWKSETDINPEHVLVFGDKDNFWEMGETGPCGPCSEIHIDLGEEVFEKLGIEPVEGGVNSDSPRFIELWNLVFIQYFRDEKGKLHDLPSKHVDTGMGFERVVAVLQNKYSNYDIDLFQDIIKGIEKISGMEYHKSSENEKVAFRVIADHIRTLTFAVTDGAAPSNEGRGYVLRRILRRAARYGRVLELKEPFLHKLVDTVVQVMSDAFSEIEDKKDHVAFVIKTEEEQFNRTLDRGLEIFSAEAEKLKKSGEKIFPGETAFRLYDTYGFPMDLTRVLCEEQGFSLDEEAFEKNMEIQRERARNAANFNVSYDDKTSWTLFSEEKGDKFIGYDNLEARTAILRYAKPEDDTYIVVLRETPFYAESGGQVADHGVIRGDDFVLEVNDVRKDNDEILHYGRLIEGKGISGSDVTAVVDAGRRLLTAYNHTATHLLHAALRKVLGDHVQQAGSLVEPGRLRFDFTHMKKLSKEEINEIERIVNSQIRRNEAVVTEVKSFDEARKEGAMALFGEKYGDVVRTVTVPGFSKELCGGTHVNRTGDIGMMKIVAESAVASGIRRIEAITGPAVEDELRELEEVVNELSRELNAREEELPDKVKKLLEEKKQLEKELKKAQTGNLADEAAGIIAGAMDMGGAKYIEYRNDSLEVKEMKELADLIRERSGKKTLGILAAEREGKALFCVFVSDDLIKENNLKAGELISTVARLAGGGGGGRPHLATAGGKQPEKIPAALEKMKSLVTEKLG